MNEPGRLANICAETEPSHTPETIRFSADDLRKYQKPGIYRHFDVEGKLLYIGETDNFLARTATHLKESHWRKEIHTIELEVCPKPIAQEKEIEAIIAELPIYNMRRQPVVTAQAKEERARRQAEISEQVRQWVKEHQPRRAEGGKYHQPTPGGDLTWDGSLENYVSIFDDTAALAKARAGVAGIGRG